MGRVASLNVSAQNDVGSSTPSVSKWGKRNLVSEQGIPNSHIYLITYRSQRSMAHISVLNNIISLPAKSHFNPSLSRPISKRQLMCTVGPPGGPSLPQSLLLRSRPMFIKNAACVFLTPSDRPILPQKSNCDSQSLQFLSVPISELNLKAARMTF